MKGKTEHTPAQGKRTRLFLFTAVFCVSVFLGGCTQVTPLSDYEKGMAALQSGDFGIALNYFDASIHTEGEEALGYRGAGLTYMSSRDYAAAAEAFRNCLDSIEYPGLNKKFTEDVQMYLADAYEKDGQPDKAITIYSQLLHSDYAAEAYLLRGKLYAAEKKFGQAGQDFERAIELDADFEVYLQIYDVYVRLNRQADGAAYLKEAKGKTTDSVRDSYQMGKICYLLGDLEEAKSHLIRAVDGKIDGASALLGRVYLDLGDTVSAKGVFQRCIDTQNQVSAGYNGLALCAIEAGNYDEALQLIHTGLQGADRTISEELLYNEIVACERKYDFATALEKMESFVAMYPGNTSASREYLFLKSRIAEMNSEPEDISYAVWDEIIRQWEEEEAAAALAGEDAWEDDYYEDDVEEWIYDEVTGEYYDPEDLEGVYYGAYTEENY